MFRNHFHKISQKDILTFKRYCEPDSHFFSNSEAFVNAYLPRDTALCYNDGKIIFFICSIGKDFYFFCCPKGPSWQSTMFDIILSGKKKLPTRCKKIWLWELTQPLSIESLTRGNYRCVVANEEKRFLSDLSVFKSLPNFLKKSSNSHLRKKWNRFLNVLYAKEGICELFRKSLSPHTYKDALQIINNWRKHIPEGRQNGQNKFITGDLVFKKNVRMIHDALNNPHLYESFILYCNGNPRGLKVAFKIEKSWNISGSISCTDYEIDNTGVALNLLFFEFLAQKGYRWFNWGNSYMSSIANFKRQFHPSNYESSYEYFIEIDSS